MNTKTKVVVKREWHKPQVELWVSHQEVGLAVTLDDFLQALVEEMGKPTFLVTKAQLLVAARAASDRVTEKLKTETTKIV